MASRNVGTTKDGARFMVSNSGKGASQGPSNKNVKQRRDARPNPTGGIRSLTGPIKGPDKGTG